MADLDQADLAALARLEALALQRSEQVILVERIASIGSAQMMQVRPARVAARAFDRSLMGRQALELSNERLI